MSGLSGFLRFNPIYCEAASFAYLVYLNYKAKRTEPIMRMTPTPIPTKVGQEVPDDGRDGPAVGAAVGALVGVAVGLAVAVGAGVAVPVGAGVEVAAETVKVKAVQARGAAAFGLVGAVGATACCLS